MCGDQNVNKTGSSYVKNNFILFDKKTQWKVFRVVIPVSDLLMSYFLAGSQYI